MKDTYASSLWPVAHFAVLSPALTAQPPNASPRIFANTVSYHVADEGRTAYEGWMKEKFRRFAEGLMKEDSALRYVIATRVIFGGVKEPEANAYVTFGSEGVPKPSLEIRNKVAKQLFEIIRGVLGRGSPLPQAPGTDTHGAGGWDTVDDC